MNIVAREILDSRGNPTVEVDLHTDKGAKKKSNTRISVQLSAVFVCVAGLDIVPHLI